MKKSAIRITLLIAICAVLVAIYTSINVIWLQLVMGFTPGALIILYIWIFHNGAHYRYEGMPWVSIAASTWFVVFMSTFTNASVLIRMAGVKGFLPTFISLMSIMAICVLIDWRFRKIFECLKARQCQVEKLSTDN